MIWSPLDQNLVVITGGPNNKNIYLVSISQVIEHNQNETTLTLDQFYQSPGVTCLEWHKLVSFLFFYFYFLFIFYLFFIYFFKYSTKKKKK